MFYIEVLDGISTFENFHILRVDSRRVEIRINTFADFHFQRIHLSPNFRKIYLVSQIFNKKIIYNFILKFLTNNTK